MVAMASHLLVELDFAAALSSCKNPSEKYVYSVYMCWYRNKVKIDKALVEIQIQNHDEEIVKISLDKGEVGDDLENRVVVLQEEKVPGHGKKSVSTQLKQQVKDLPPLEFELACPQNKEEKVPRRGKKSVSTQLKQQVKDSPPLEFEGACAQRKEKSQKQHGPIFRADAYCTFSSCPVIAKLTISNKSIQADNVIAQVNFTGFVHHATGEKQARKISSSVRSQLKQHFQSTHVAPSKEYHKQLKMLASEQYAAGNRDGVGCSSSVMRTISSEARLALQFNKDLIASLLLLKNCIIKSENESIAKPRVVKGFIQHIHASPFSVICFNEASVRLYHEVSKNSSLFCDATGTIVALPKQQGKQPTVYYYAVVLKHPNEGKSPLAVAELITEDHTVLSVSFFLQSLRRAESQLYNSSNLTIPPQVIIDRSQVLLISFLNVYNMESIEEYLHRTFRKMLYCSKMESKQMKSAYNSLADFINSLDKDCFQEQSVESEDHDHEDNRDELHPTQHPFGAYFSKKVDNITLSDQGSVHNEYYNPEYFDMLMKNWFSIAPFWSALMLGSMKVKKHLSKKQRSSHRQHKLLTVLLFIPLKSAVMVLKNTHEFGSVIDVGKKKNKGLENASFVCWLNAAIQALLTTPLHTMLEAMKPLNSTRIQNAFLCLCNELEGNQNHPCDSSDLAHAISAEMGTLKHGLQNDCCEGIIGLLKLLTQTRGASSIEQYFSTRITKQSMCCNKTACEISTSSVISCAVANKQGHNPLDMIKDWIQLNVTNMEGPQVVSEDNRNCRKLNTRVNFPSRNEWISYNDTRVSVISNQDYNNSPEVQENATIAIYTALMASVLLDKCNSSIPPPYLLKFTELEYTGLTIHLESELKMKGAKPHSRFQLEKCNLMSLMAGEWIDSKIITSYMDLLQDSKLNGQKVFCFDPTFLPVYKAKGYNAVRRHCKVKNIMDYDCLLFPVHTPQHWCLVVVYPQVHEIHCIDSLQQSNYDAINWIWMYLANEMRYAWNIQMLRSDWKYNDTTSNHSMQKNSHDCGAFVCFAARLLVESYPCLHTQEMMGGFRLQMAHELSCGVLYALQSDRSSCVSITIDDSHSGIQDDTAKHGQSDCDDMEIDQTDQLGDDGDMDDEDDADESDEERTADPNFLVPTYENEPDPNDIFGLKWGKDHYFKYLPRLKRMPYTEEQCPFEREFIRKVVKEMEPTIRVIQSGKKKSVFFRHIPAIEKCLKADANWPLQHCCDMVLEIFHYLMETESDVKSTASVCTSRINKIIVWPEIITALIAIKFNVSRKQAISHFLNNTLP
eukprot:Em0014g312a